MNSYQLTRSWFDFAFENSDKVKSQHTALFVFIVEHNNRLGWREQFQLPSPFAMECTGIKSYKTYIKTLYDLIAFGFIQLISKSKNQYSANVIKILIKEKSSKNLSSLDKAILNTQEQNSLIIEAVKKALSNAIDEDYFALVIFTNALTKADTKASTIAKAESIEKTIYSLKQRVDVSGLIEKCLEHSQADKKVNLIKQILKLSDFQSYLWQNFESFQSIPNSSQLESDSEFVQCQSLFKSFAPSYVWQDIDNKHLQSLLQKIQSSIKQTESESSVEETFKYMLEHLPNWWRNRKFTLSHLDTNYNEIINEIQQSHEKDQRHTTQEFDEYARNFGK
jgi:hypothetical protein